MPQVLARRVEEIDVAQAGVRIVEMEELEPALAGERHHEGIQLHDLAAAVETFRIQQQFEFAVRNAWIDRPGTRHWRSLAGLRLAGGLAGLRRRCRGLGIGLLLSGHGGRIGDLDFDLDVSRLFATLLGLFQLGVLFGLLRLVRLGWLFRLACLHGVIPFCLSKIARGPRLARHPAYRNTLLKYRCPRCRSSSFWQAPWRSLHTGSRRRRACANRQWPLPASAIR